MSRSRRDLLGLVGSAVLARWAAGCDRLVVVDGQRVAVLDPITSNEDHYVYTVSYPLPEVDPAAHRTVVLHEDAPLAEFDLAFLEALGAVDREHTLQCIGSGPINLAIGNAIWSGRPLRDVLDALGVEVPSSAVGLRLVGADTTPFDQQKYHAGLPIEDLDDGPLWLVWRMNGVAVPHEHGGPYRLLVPGRYGVKNVKWPIEIAFVDTPHVSFWTPMGWSEEAVYRPNTFVLTPADAVEVEAGERVRFAGSAFAGSDAVERVEVSLDGGEWEEAVLDYENGPDVWVLWSWDWLAKPGEHRLQARCTTRSGARSNADPQGTDLLSGYDGSMEITVRAT